MSDLVGNHIVGFPTRRLISLGTQPIILYENPSADTARHSAGIVPVNCILM